MQFLTDTLTVAALGALKFALLILLLSAAAWVSGLSLAAMDVPYERIVARKGVWMSVPTEYRTRRIARAATGQGLIWIRGGLDFLLPRVAFGLTSSLAAWLGGYAIWSALASVADGGPLAYPITEAAVFLLIGYVVYVLSPLGIIRAFNRMVERNPRSVGWPPVFPVVDGWIDAESRLAATKALYRFHTYLVMLAVAALTTGLAVWEPYFRAEQRGDDTDYAFRLALLGTVLVVVYWWAARRLIRARVRRLHALDRLTLTVQREQQDDRKPAFDAGGRHRRQLQAVLAATDRYAWYLQKSAAPGVRHPIAYLLRLGGAHMREFLSSNESVLWTVPPEIVETLKRMTVLTAGTSHTLFLTETGERLCRFSEQLEGTPATRRAPRFTAGIDLTDKTTILATRIALIALAVWLLASRQVETIEFVQLLP
jgi:multisubunit Na+/H+ antiporter MnhG subunit